MTVPVLWVSLHPDTILARGYADEGLLEAIFDRTLWRPPAALDFEHHEVNGPFPGLALGGAVVVIPCRHHVAEATFLRDQLDRLAWSVVILAGDEAWDFPWEVIPETETRRIWTMQPIPPHIQLSGRIPGGWYQWPDSPNTPALIRPWATEATERPLDWFFAGQNTHERREECVKILERLQGGRLATTDGYMREAIPRADYFRLIASAKVVPSPSGPYSVDCARPLEALEAGAVPVVDYRKPRDPQFDYWDLCFGPDHPLRGVNDWAQFPGILAEEVAAWPASGNKVYAWWQQWKRRITLQLDSDIHAVRGTEPELVTPDDLITVIVTTSPAPLHPSTEHIEEVIASVRAQLPTAEIIVVADGCRNEQSARRPAYEAYLQRLFWLCNFEWDNVVPVRLGLWGHQIAATRAAMTLVRTPLVFFVEHDTPIMGEIDWEGLCAFTLTGEANAVRLHIDTSIYWAHEALMLDHETRWVDVGRTMDVPLRRTAAWWQRPHLARADFYRDRILPLFPEDAFCFIEDYLYGLLSSAYHDRGEAGWWDWRVWTYTPDTPIEEGGMKRSGHLDSRAGDPKYDQIMPPRP